MVLLTDEGKTTAGPSASLFPAQDDRKDGARVIFQECAVGTDCPVCTARLACFAGHPSREPIHAHQNVPWIQQFAL
jgi:hypothetical protein